MAAAAIRQLTGPISITQEPIPGKKHGARWIATFSPNLLALLHQIAKDKDYPDSMTLEFLSHGIWTTPMEVSAVIDEIPKYERLAPIFKEMRDNGASIQTIAAAHELTWDQVKKILHFADTGERPKWPKKKKESKGNGANREKYMSHCDEVVRRRSAGQSFAKIALELDLAEQTVRRAWDHANLDATAKAAATGATPNRGSYRHLPTEKIQEAQKLLKEGKLTIREIATQTGLSPSTIRREKHRVEKQ
ncbi:helix-turn-helix domain-containing protein [Planctomicrobium sp. SH527]|uniref:helix-turn-helix domain-containing protein n=1 Tax=Planctomicrobium sp. SH527 TaxID=3448123 RepID=UPI003F5B2636